MDMMNATSTAAATAASAASTSMSMSMDGDNSCKIFMLWNWYTVDSCFIARSWHVTSKGAFAGSCIGVVLLVVALELLRRSQRELDRYFRRINGAPTSCGNDGVSNFDGLGEGSNSISSKIGKGPNSRPCARQLKLWQQLVRAALFTVQFAVGYFIMLLAMYYNGYIIICIFLGAFLGALIFQWDTYNVENDGPETRDSCCN